MQTDIGMEPKEKRMLDDNTPLVLVVCNDYGELALAMYLLEGQTFAHNATLMLPPKLHAQNPDVLPGRTYVYHSLEDVEKRMDSQTPGILGLLSGYLLPVHHLCEPDALDSLLRSTQAMGWRSFTSDPFLGLLDNIEASELFALNSPKGWFAKLAANAASVNARVTRLGNAMRRQLKSREDPATPRNETTRLLNEMHRMLQANPHVYACADSPNETDSNIRTRLHFHNSAAVSKPKTSSAFAPTSELAARHWLFVLGDHDYLLQKAKYGRMFPLILTHKLHETLESGRVPVLIAPENVIAEVRTHSPVMHAMELLGHCGYSQFQSLLIDAEYVFYWNAVSFSCILRTLSGKPWFAFEAGHLLGGLNAEYGKRISDWFYRGGLPPYLNIGNSISNETMLDATQQYLPSAERMQRALLDTPTPGAILSAIANRAKSV